MSNRKALKGAIAAIASVATLGALAAPALADETTTYNLNGKSVAELAQHGGAQRIAAIGNGNAKTKSGSPMASMWPNPPDSTAMQCFPTSSRTSPATWSPLPTAPLRSPACVSSPPRSGAENLK